MHPGRSPGAAGSIAQWFFQQGDHLRTGNTPARTLEHVHPYRNRDRTPPMLLALDDGPVMAGEPPPFRAHG